MKHNEFTPHAYITLSNMGGIEIMLNRSNDGVYYRFNYGQDNLGSEEIFESPVDYYLDNNDNESESRSFFTHSGTVYFLDEAMRIAR